MQIPSFLTGLQRACGTARPYIGTVLPIDIDSPPKPEVGAEVGAEPQDLGPPVLPLLDGGPSGGSDCPVEPPHPLWGMAAARDRCGIVPDQGLSAGEALALFTSGAAAALDEPDPLAVGSPADFVILDRDPLQSTPDQLRDANVIATYIDGRQVDVSNVDQVWRD